MKRFIFIATVMLSAVAMVSCGKDDNAKKKDAVEDDKAYEIDMGHPKPSKTISSNMVGEIDGTDWQYEQWYEGGNSAMTVWSNGTFKATWNNSMSYLGHVGYYYSSASAVSHTDKNFAADYNYVKSGSGGQYNYIGAYGWTVQPLVEWYIIDDWFGNEPAIPKWYKKLGSIDVDGSEYTIYVSGKVQQPALTGKADFVQVWSVRKTNRQKGHMSLQSHFKLFDSLLHGQSEHIPIAENYNTSFTLKWGKLVEVSLGLEVDGSASGTIEYNHFNITDNQQ